MLVQGAAEGEGAAKAVGGVRGKEPVPDLLALAPRPPAVCEAQRRCDKRLLPRVARSSLLARQRELRRELHAGAAVAPVLPV